MKKNIRFIAALLCTMFCLFTMQAACAAVIDPAVKGTLTLNVVNNGAGVQGVEFKIYRVASMNDEAQFVMLDGWSAGSVDIQNITGAEAWSSFAQSMQVQAADRAPIAFGTTRSDGHLKFLNVPVGLYLVVGTPATIDQRVYSFMPALVSVPNKVDGAYNFNVSVAVKFEVADEEMELEVLKVWNDEGYTNNRPESIIVDLCCDGEVVQSVELSRENNWHYTFEHLSRLHNWAIVEKVVPEGYNVSYRMEGTTQIITNTVIVPPTTPPPSPQTGLTWWPVPVLGGLGVMLFVLGLVAHRKWRNEHEES